jgi:hypothetical protein
VNAVQRLARYGIDAERDRHLRGFGVRWHLADGAITPLRQCRRLRRYRHLWGLSSRRCPPFRAIIAPFPSHRAACSRLVRRPDFRHSGSRDSVFSGCQVAQKHGERVDITRPSRIAFQKLSAIYEGVPASRSLDPC